MIEYDGEGVATDSELSGCHRHQRPMRTRTAISGNA